MKIRAANSIKAVNNNKVVNSRVASRSPGSNSSNPVVKAASRADRAASGKATKVARTTSANPIDCLSGRSPAQAGNLPYGP